MHLTGLDILNFKNIAEARLDFSPRVNGLLGRNGMGKSNLLDAVHYACMGRPVTSLRDSELMRHGEQTMMVRAVFSTPQATEEVDIGIQAGRRKVLRRNGKDTIRLADHIGRFPVVAVTPRDIELLGGPAEERRRFMDRTLSQTDPAYLAALSRAARGLDARNKMLRAGIRDQLLYDSVETQLCAAMTAVHDIRVRWAADIAPLFSRYYRIISGNAEEATITYVSELDRMSASDILLRNSERDRALGYTSGGTHRDDLAAGLDGHDMRRIGSQGQMKTYVTALRLAVYDYLRQRSARMPILLLDDIFDKLDATRVESIMTCVSEPGAFGQIFVTDTNRSHLDLILDHLGADHRLYRVENGAFRPAETEAAV